MTDPVAAPHCIVGGASGRHAKHFVVTAVVALFVHLSAGCKPAPTPEELKSRDEAIARSVQWAQEEDRARDRQLLEQAQLDAQRMMPADTLPGAPGGDPAPTQVQAAATVLATAAAEERDTAQFLERIRRTLLHPGAMEVRDPSLREKSTAFCAEVNARTRGGAMTGFTPVIVTADRVLFYQGIKDALDPGETLDLAEFLKANLQLRCWIIAGASK